jgi:hypothetical protein
MTIPAPEPVTGCPHCTEIAKVWHPDPHRPWELEYLDHLRCRHRSLWETVMAQASSDTAARTRDLIAERAGRRAESGL